MFTSKKTGGEVGDQHHSKNFPPKVVDTMFDVMREDISNYIIVDTYSYSKVEVWTTKANLKDITNGERYAEITNFPAKNMALKVHVLEAIPLLCDESAEIS